MSRRGFWGKVGKIEDFLIYHCPVGYAPGTGLKAST